MRDEETRQSRQSGIKEEVRAARRLLFLLAFSSLVFTGLLFGTFALIEHYAILRHIEADTMDSATYLDGLIFSSARKLGPGDNCPYLISVDTANQPSETVAVRVINGKTSSKSPLDGIDQKALAHLKHKAEPILLRSSNHDHRAIRYYNRITLAHSCKMCHAQKGVTTADATILRVEAYSPVGEGLNRLERLTLVLAASVALVLLGLIYLLGWKGMRARIDAIATVRRHSRSDPLTHLMNRPTAISAVEREVERVRRTGGVLTLMVLDIDHFRNINRRYGRKFGDRVLVDMAERLVTELRAYDQVGRSGNNEFTIILPATALTEGMEVAERIRRVIAATPFRFGRMTTPVHVSIGAVELTDQTEPVDRLLGRVHGALGNAKANGGNRVETDDVFRIKP